MTGKQKSLDVVKSFAMGMCCAFLLIDGIEVVSGSVNLNTHIPFLYPAVFGVFILIIRKIENGTTRPSPERYSWVQDRATLPSQPPPRNPEA